MNYHGTVAGSVLLAAITANLQLGYCLNTMGGGHGVYRLLPDERKRNTRNKTRDFILAQLMSRYHLLSTRFFSFN